MSNKKLFYFLKNKNINECKSKLNKYILDNKSKLNINYNKINMNEIVKDFFNQQYYPLREDKYKDNLIHDCKQYLEEKINEQYLSNTFENEDISIALKNKKIQIPINKTMKYAIYSDNVKQNSKYIKNGCNMFLIKQPNKSLVDLSKNVFHKNDTIFINSLSDISDNIEEILIFLNRINKLNIILYLDETEYSISTIIKTIQQILLLKAEKIEKIKKIKNEEVKKKNNKSKQIIKKNKVEITKEDYDSLVVFGGKCSYLDLANKKKCSRNEIKKRVHIYI